MTSRVRAEKWIAEFIDRHLNTNAGEGVNPVTTSKILLTRGAAEDTIHPHLLIMTPKHNSYKEHKHNAYETKQNKTKKTTRKPQFRFRA